MFASVANDGRIEIWDLKEPLAPKQTWFDHDPKDVKRENLYKGKEFAKTVVRFNDSISPVLFTGNIKGQIGVYRSYGLEHVKVSDEDQRKRLIDAIRGDTFTESKDSKKSEDDE